MRLLITADLHLNIRATNRRTGRSVLESLAESISAERPDAVVVAGDLGSPEAAARHLRALRETVGDLPLAVTLGNHDFWLPEHLHPHFDSLALITERYWAAPARDCGIVLLDAENMTVGDCAVVGAYGHFDLGLAYPGLEVRGRRVTTEDYMSGWAGRFYWNDFEQIPRCAQDLQIEAERQAEGLARRLAHACESRLVVATHTCPWRELIGHPRRGADLDMLAAYSGNARVGQVLEQFAELIELAVCGHTHHFVEETALRGIRCLNVGADYGIFRGITYDTTDRSIRWVGEPLSNR